MEYRTRHLLFFIPFLVVLLLIVQYVFSLMNTESNPIPVSSGYGDSKIEAKDTLVFCYGGTNVENRLKTAIHLFEKEHPSVKIKVKPLPASTNLQKDFYTLALHSGDNSIDVFLADMIWTAEFAAAGWILPLDGYVGPSMENVFLPGALESCKYKGRYYALPGNIDIPVLYYRSDILSSPPETNEELVQLSKLHQESSGLKYGYVFAAQSYEGLVCTALEFIWNNGGAVIENDLVAINSPEAIEGLQQLIDIVNSTVATLDVLNFQDEDARIAFQDGNALFMRNWPYSYNQMASPKSKVAGKYRIAPLPLGPNGKVSRCTLGGFNFMINKKTKNQKLAWEFVQWMVGSEAQPNPVNYKEILPVRKSVYNDLNFHKSNPWVKQFSDLIGNSCLRPLSPHYASISESMQINFNNTIRCKISAKTAIENIENDLIHIRPLDKD